MTTEESKPEDKSCVALKPVDIVQCARCAENKHIRMKRVKIHSTASMKRYKTRRKGDNFLSFEDVENEKQNSKKNSLKVHTKLSSKDNCRQKAGMVLREDRNSVSEFAKIYAGDYLPNKESERHQNEYSRLMCQKDQFQKFGNNRSKPYKHQKDNGLEHSKAKGYISFQYETSRENPADQKTKSMYYGLINDSINVMENGIFYRAMSENKHKDVVKHKTNSFLRTSMRSVEEKRHRNETKRKSHSSPRSTSTRSVEVIETTVPLASNRYKYSDEHFERPNDHKEVTTVKIEIPEDKIRYNTSTVKLERRNMSLKTSTSKRHGRRLRGSDEKTVTSSIVLNTNKVKKETYDKERSVRPKLHPVDRYISSDEDDADEVLNLVQIEIQNQFKNEEAARLRCIGNRSEVNKSQGTVYKDHERCTNKPDKAQNNKTHSSIEIQNQSRHEDIKIIPVSKMNRKSDSKYNNNINKPTDSVFEFQVVPIRDKEYKKGVEVQERNTENRSPSIKDPREKAFCDSDINNMNETKQDVPNSVIDIQDIGVNLQPPHHKAAMMFKVVRVPSKRDQKKMVKVGGGWSNINHYYERHEPVQRFEYNRSTDNKGQSFLSFKSHYKFPTKTKHKPKAKKQSRKVPTEN